MRWVRFVDEEGLGLEFSGIEPLGFSAHHNSIEDFDAGPERAGHTYDIKKPPEVYINLDHLQMGVGGNNSWGARPLPQYNLSPEDYQYSFIIRRVGG